MTPSDDALPALYLAPQIKQDRISVICLSTVIVPYTVKLPQLKASFIL